jgi:predicted component of viral defense system (DUF524 family)
METVVPLLNNKLGLRITYKGKRTDALRFDTSAKEKLEAEIQLMEACSYEYTLLDGTDKVAGYELKGYHGTVEPFSSQHHLGHIKPGNYVGTLPVEILKDGEKVGEVEFEVRSYKSSYREDYREMLDYISKQSTEILLQHSSPVTQNLTFDFDSDAETLYQRFAFVSSIIESEEFEESVHRILTMPVTAWKDDVEDVDIRRAGRFGNAAVKMFAKGTNRLALPNGHALRSVGLASVPATVPKRKRYETVDTPENRFILFALTTFQQFCADVGEKLAEKGSVREAKHADLVIDKLEEWLSHSVFKEVGRPNVVPLNSPVLQRKEGYREVLSAWLMFDLAAKLIWKGGDDIYKAGKKDVAKLYEYWVFFKLLEKLSKKFDLTSKSIEELIKKTDDGLSLNLIEGQHTAIEGAYDAKSRKLRIKFSFNRTFSGKKDYPTGGSWTRQMRPDYTLSMWPDGMTDTEAEEAELIVHIHFDAKYKINNVKRWVDSADGTEEKVEQANVGSFKREDLLKMHAYKDAIRRTGGAYILYPGEEGWSREGFHEVVPGLGAFPLRPSKTNDGSGALTSFIDKVVSHLLDRASQRESNSYHSYRIHKGGPGEALHEPLPEVYGGVRTAPVDEVTVLVGYYKTEKQLEWIERKWLYNTRTGSGQGSIDLGPKVTGATYLLLHGAGETLTNKLYRLTNFRADQKGPRVYSKEKLESLGYTNPSGDYYAVFKLSNEEIPTELQGITWGIHELPGYVAGHGSALPFAVTLKELMKSKVQ